MPATRRSSRLQGLGSTESSSPANGSGSNSSTQPEQPVIPSPRPPRSSASDVSGNGSGSTTGPELPVGGSIRGLGSIAYMAIVKEAAKDVPDFTESTEVTEWIGRFQRATQDLEESDKLKLFARKLMANDYHWFTITESTGSISTIEGWFEAIRLKYKKSAEDLLLAIENRKQTETESAESFGNDLLKKIAQYNPGMAEPERIMHFKRNLHVKYEKLFAIMGSNITSYATAVQTLQRAMTLAQKESPKSEDTSLFLAEKRSGPPQRSGSKFCGHCKRSGHLESDCYRKNGYPKQSRFRKESGSFRGKCWKCFRVGHKEEDCRDSGSNRSDRPDRDRDSKDRRRPADRSDRGREEKRRRSRSPQKSESGNGK